MEELSNWYEEKSSAYLYRIIALQEKDPTRKTLFLELEKLASKQAHIWEEKLKKSNSIPIFKPTLRTRLVGKLITYFGVQKIRFILSAMKVRGMSVYLNQDPNYPYPTTPSPHENRHKSIQSAGNLRAAVFGVNDGLISNMSLILGIAGASASANFILLSGIAGLLAGAFSMAAGEYVSVRSQREFFEYQIDIERQELKLYPEEEALELASIYRARGLNKMDSEKLAALIISNPEKALDTLAREELGLDPNQLGSPIGAALSSFFSFAAGAFIPLFPFLFGPYHLNLIFSIALAAGSLFSIGAGLSLFTNTSAFWSGFRMLLIGSFAGFFTYWIGHFVGAVLN